jgi:hypothetical protein
LTSIATLIPDLFPRLADDIAIAARDAGMKALVLKCHHESTISPAWQYAVPSKVVEAITRVGASRCLLVSDTGHRHNPLPSEALRIFSQTLFEKGVSAEDLYTMIVDNPRNVLELDTTSEPLDDTAETWAAATAVTAREDHDHEAHAHADGRAARPIRRDSIPVEYRRAASSRTDTGGWNPGEHREPR